MMRKAASRRTLGIGVKAANASSIDLEPESGFVEVEATSPDVIILCAVKFWMSKVESSGVLANTRFSACELLVQRWDVQKLGGKPQEGGALHRRYKYEHNAGHSGVSESVDG
jgi:hypothetical protein